MTRRMSLFVQLLAYGFALAYSLWLLPHIPDRVPVHWGIDGKPDRWGSPWELVSFTPIVAAIMVGLTLALPKRMGKEAEDASRMGTMYQVTAYTSLLMAGIQLVILQSAQGSPIDAGKFILALVGLFFAILGNLMGKLRRNRWIGIRTPWTLRSDAVWEASHRRAAYLWFFGGLAVAFLALSGAHLGWAVALLLFVSLWSLVDSYIVSKRIG